MSNNRIFLEINPAVLVALEHALKIGAVTQMMCSNPEAQAAVDEVRKQVSEMIPVGAFLFTDNDWTRIINEVSSGNRCEVREIKHRRHWQKGWWSADTYLGVFGLDKPFAAVSEDPITGNMSRTKLTGDQLVTAENELEDYLGKFGDLS